MKEYGSLEEIVDHLREKQAEKELQYVKALAKAEEEEAEEGSAEEGGESEGDADGIVSDGEKKQKPRKGVKKGAGGIHVPEEWLWEEAKKLFEKPDVIPANEIEVRFVLLPWSSSHPSPLCHKLISSY